MPRIKRNIKLPDRVLNWLQAYANGTVTVSKICENPEYDRFLDVGEYQESNYETAEWIAQELCKLCNIEGKVDRRLVEIEKEYMEGQRG